MVGVNVGSTIVGQITQYPHDNGHFATITASIPSFQQNPTLNLVSHSNSISMHVGLAVGVDDGAWVQHMEQLRGY